MRKILSILLLISTLLLLASCGGGDAPPLTEADSALLKIAEKLEYSYDAVVISVSTKYGDTELMDRYSITYFDDSVVIDYIVESLVPFEYVDGEYQIPEYESGIIQDFGTVKLDSNGKVISGGDGKTDYAALANVRLNLRSEYFSKLTYSSTGLTGTISNLSALYSGLVGMPGTGVDMVAEYNETAFVSLLFSYTTQLGAQVTVDFDFLA